MKYIAVAKTSELSPGEKIKIDLEGREILIVNVDGSYHAFDNKCPHMGASLFDGKIDGNNIV